MNNLQDNIIFYSISFLILAIPFMTSLFFHRLTMRVTKITDIELPKSMSFLLLIFGPQYLVFFLTMIGHGEVFPIFNMSYIGTRELSY